MKKMILGLVLILALGSQAQAYYECMAVSPSGWGVGQADNEFVAQNIALNNCAVNTPGWQICRISYCNWKW